MSLRLPAVESVSEGRNGGFTDLLILNKDSSLYTCSSDDGIAPLELSAISSLVPKRGKINPLLWIDLETKVSIFELLRYSFSKSGIRSFHISVASNGGISNLRSFVPNTDFVERVKEQVKKDSNLLELLIDGEKVLTGNKQYERISFVKSIEEGEYYGMSFVISASEKTTVNQYLNIVSVLGNYKRELRNREAQNKYGKVYKDLNSKERKEIRGLVHFGYFETGEVK